MMDFDSENTLVRCIFKETVTVMVNLSVIRGKFAWEMSRLSGSYSVYGIILRISDSNSD